MPQHVNAASNSACSGFVSRTRQFMHGWSCGSAGVCAAGLVAFTFGEHSRGSILRSASFCGVTGFKPTHDLLPIQGVLNLAKSLDTLGFFTHTPADMLELWKATGKATG